MTRVPDKRSFVFFGEDIFSLTVLESLLNPELGLLPLAVVVLEPVSVSGMRLTRFCEDKGIPLVRTNSVGSEEFLSRFTDMEIDLMVTAHFQRLLPPVLFTKAKIGAMNLHPSLLPRYRGMSPQHWPIILGDSATGVTVHRIEEEVDTGRILCQVRILLEKGIYIHELQIKLLEVYRTVMVEAIKRAIAGDPGEIQSTKGVSYYHKISEKDMEINLETGVERAENMIRAFSFPYAGAKFLSLRIMRAVRVEDSKWARLKATNPELGIVDNVNRRFLMLKDGALELTKWKIT